MNPVDLALTQALRALVDITRADGADRDVYCMVRARVALDHLAELVPSLVRAACAPEEVPPDDKLH